MRGIRRIRVLQAMVAGAAVTLSGCGGDGDGGNGPGPTQSIQVVVSATTLTVQQGGTGSVTVTLTRGGGFSGAVSLTVEGLPPGVTPTVTPAQLTGSTTSATIAVAVAGTVDPGTYPVTVRASASGVGAATATYTLTVTAAPAYTLAANPSALTIAQGASGITNVVITRTNFPPAVSLALDNPPAGITGSFNPVAPTGNSSELTVSVPASTAAGTYTLTIRGQASGLTDRQATLQVTVVAVSGYTLSLSPATLTLPQAGAGQVTVNIARTNFTGAVDLSLQNPPAGIGGAFNPTSPTGTTSTLGLTVAQSVAPGNYQVVIKGSATGQPDRTVTLSLTVTAAPASSIALSITPAGTLSISQGSSGQVTVNIARTNFGGAVTLAYSGAPSGLTLAFNPQPATGISSVLSVSAGAALATGTYNITITGSGTGIANATTQLAVQVLAASGGNVEFQFCSTSENPMFFAYQDGSGPWTQVAATTVGTTYRYRFNIASGRGGVFYVQTSSTGGSARAGRPHKLLAGMQAQRTSRFPARTRLSAAALADVYETSVIFATQAELANAGTENCADSQPQRTVFAPVAGVALGQLATISLGGGTATFIGGLSTSPVRIEDVATGTVDLFAARQDATGVPDKLFDARNLDPADGSTLPFTVDFGGPLAYAPASATLTLANTLGDEAFTATAFQTAHGAVGTFVGPGVPTTATTRTWYGVPAAKTVAGDLHNLLLFAAPSGSTGDNTRFQFAYSAAVQNRTLTLGPRIATPTFTTVAGAPYRRLRAQGTIASEYQKQVIISYQPDAGGNSVLIGASGGYLAAIGTPLQFDLTVPDLTALAGFPVFTTLPGGSTEASVTALGWTGSGVLFPVPDASTIVQAATRYSLINVP
jgi:hypothetical protein